jgi:hypothetical protein
MEPEGRDGNNRYLIAAANKALQAPTIEKSAGQSCPIVEAVTRLLF